ncbi:MAG: beta-lactamase family protein [Acidobacteria bacterium]|nr:beta-lactamase family protein [Acidobacteriota bacterium]MYE43861.1 beta-lactamase family protein [Acidobacteriota bacterium]
MRLSPHFPNPLLLRSITACLAFGLAVACGPAAEPEPVRSLPEVTAAASEEIRRVIEEDGRGGGAFGIVVAGETVVADGFGFADTEGETPARADHLYRIGSITKPVTAMAMLRLVHLERARFGDPVTEFVPELAEVENPYSWTPGPSIFQLATMTAGLAREPRNLPRYLVGAPQDWLDTALRALDEVSFEYEPGTRYQYSNIGYAMLGAAVERAIGEPFMDHVRDNLLAPLGMDSSTFFPVPQLEERIAEGVTVKDDGSLDAETPAREHAGRGYKVPNGALYSTVADLGVFLRFLIGTAGEPFDGVIPASVRQDNLTKAFSTGDLASGYGFGFMSRRVDDADGDPFTAYGHGGGVAGYRAAAWIEPETDAAVILLRNVGGDGLSLSELSLAALAQVVAAIR